uniref:Tetratricopeptide repeat protein 31 n=1 Tax=Leptobrachium leishanense TaxID=445787 RepID=A0A8C5N5B4_9ANUR
MWSREMDYDSDEDGVLDDYWYYNGGEVYGDDEDDGGFAFSQNFQAYLRLRSSLLPHQFHQLPQHTVTQEEADRNAKELLEEEINEKEKINKKRRKKKRQKDRKRQQKLEAAACNMKDPVSLRHVVVVSLFLGSEPGVCGTGDISRWVTGNGWCLRVLGVRGSNLLFFFNLTPSRVFKPKVTDANKPEVAPAPGSVDPGSSKEEKSDSEIGEEDSAASGSVDLEYLKENLGKSDTEDDLDLESMFVQKAQRKADSKPKPEKSERPQGRSSERPQGRSSERPQGRSSERPQGRVPWNLVPKATAKSPGKANVVDQYQVQQSLDFANIGNNMAQMQRFSDAITYYTEAIRLNPSEYRFLGNRSYSYERCGKYNEALRDAEQAVSLHPGFIKGFFRMGKALKGLQRYAEAVAAFQKVLASDNNHTEAAAEILQCQREMQDPGTAKQLEGRLTGQDERRPPPTPSLPIPCPPP